MIHTLWGEITAQLAEESDNPALFDLIKESDKKGISPGSVTIRSVLEQCAPCLILIDELAAYTRKFFKVSGEIPAGTFENILSFVQELTEAVRATKNCLVVASIPESDIEKGGEGGMLALQSIEHTFGRMEAVWRPVAAEEGYEIVHRRLIKSIENKDVIEKTCNAYFSVYQNNPSLFPPECKEKDYLDKMKRCYPIHPEVFDRLYNDWSTIDHFQRTRGVLRFMAAVIHDLYDGNEGNAMITSGSIAVDKSSIRDELVRYLSVSWNPIIDGEIDGKDARPAKLDDAQGGYYKKQFANSRIARTVFLGSAPSSIAQRNRGIDTPHVYLGVIQPEENIPAYEAALGALADNLTYLYRSGNRYWFDTRPTLRKTVTDRAQHQAEEAVIYAVENELRNAARVSASLCYAHIAVASSSDIPDDQNFHFVLLRANETYKTNDVNSKAMSIAKEYFEKRGASPRIHRNMIAFLAPDKDQMANLQQEVKTLLAWMSIRKDAETLNLDPAQRRETEAAIQEKEQSAKGLIQSAWCHLFVPAQDGTNEVSFKDIKVSGTDNPTARAIQKMKQDDLLIENFSPKILSMEMSKKGYDLWRGKNHLQVRELWADYTQYVYLHRLKDKSVLDDAMEAGIRSGEYFYYAEDYDESGKYRGLPVPTGIFILRWTGCLSNPKLPRSNWVRKKNLHLL
jgi:predicted AAA+ superfamily ATPase